MTHITLCLIARNEEAMLPGCLESVQGAVDSIVVVDTGSEDATAALAAAAGATVVDHVWNDDFAAARNAALGVARGDWVLLLDADERLAAGAADVLRAAADEGGFDCGLLPLHDAERLDATPEQIVAGEGRRNTPMLVPRLYRRTPDLRWEGIVHEQATTWLAHHRRLRRIEAPIAHFGTVESVRVDRDKAARNLRLLEKRCALEPDNPTVRAYLTRELVRAGESQRAREVIDAAWELLEQAGEPRPDATTPATLRCWLHLGNDAFDTVLETVAQARTWDGDHPNLDLLEGVAHERLWLAEPAGGGESPLLARAADCYAACLEFGDVLFTAEPMPGATSWAAATRLGLVRILQGRYQEALAAFEQALVANPEHTEARLGRAECWIEAGRHADAIRELEALLATPGPDVWILGAVAALFGGAPDTAAPMVQAARASLAEQPLVAPHRLLILHDLEEWARGHAGPATVEAAAPPPAAPEVAPGQASEEATGEAPEQAAPARSARLPIELREDVESVSVVIPAYGRPELLKPVLEGFLAERADEPFELILVDDGSEPSLEPDFVALDPPAEWSYVRHAENRGRSAGVNTGLDLARGDVVVVCDSDVAPEKGFVRAHRDYHREHPSLLATHLGDLTWGTDPGLFGRLMGPRSNPRLRGRLGRVDWSTWFTDNWSCKRELLERGNLRFDETFHVWGFEELELAHRLERSGATNELTRAACGRHLKAATLEGQLGSFARSVPNLLHLASAVGPDPRVVQWLSFRRGDAEGQRRSEEFLAAMWERVAGLDLAAPKGLRPDLDPQVQRLAVELSDAVFRIGLGRGFLDCAGEAERRGVELPQASDAEQVLALAPLTVVFDELADRLGEPDCEETIARLGLEGDLAAAFRARREYHVGERTRLATAP